MEQIRVVNGEFKVLGKELVDKVGQLIHAGNVRRIIVKDDHENTFLEIPLTIATVGTIAVPVLAGLGAIAALIASFTIGVEKVKEEATEVRSGDGQASLHSVQSPRMESTWVTGLGEMEGTRNEE